MSKIKTGDLRPYNEVIAESYVNATDVFNAKKEWEKTPPDQDYKKILKAEVVKE